MAGSIGYVVRKMDVGSSMRFGGHIEMVDTFDKADTLRRLWGKLIRGHAVGALDGRGDRSGKEIARESARQFLGRASEGKMERYGSHGTGEDVRIHGEEVEGAALLHQQSAVHPTVFSIQWLIKMAAACRFCLAVMCVRPQDISDTQGRQAKVYLHVWRGRP